MRELKQILAEILSWVKRKLVDLVISTCVETPALIEEPEVKERMPDCWGSFSIGFAPSEDLPGLMDVEFKLQAVVNPSAVKAILTEVGQDWSRGDHQLTDFFRAVMNKSPTHEQTKIRERMEEAAIAVVQMNR